MADVAGPDEGAAIARCASWTSGGSRVIVARSLGDGDPPGGPRSADGQVLRGPRSAPTADDDEDVSRRTAVYGPVRTVAWEGRSRKAPPYPDRRPPTRRRCFFSSVSDVPVGDEGLVLLLSGAFAPDEVVEGGLVDDVGDGASDLVPELEEGVIARQLPPLGACRGDALGRRDRALDEAEDLAD